MTQNITINATQFGTTVKTGVAMEGKRRSDVTPKLTAEIRYSIQKSFGILATYDLYQAKVLNMIFVDVSDHNHNQEGNAT